MSIAWRATVLRRRHLLLGGLLSIPLAKRRLDRAARLPRFAPLGAPGE
jgi:hypothetical protein